MKDIMIKVGSSALVKDGQVNHAAVDHISDQAIRVVEQSGRAAITTSGFAAAGRGKSEAAYQAGGKLLTEAWHERLGARAGSFQLVSRLSLAAVVEQIKSEQDEGLIPIINGQWGDRCFGHNDQLAVEIALHAGLRSVVLLGTVPGVCRDLTDHTTVVDQIELDRADDYRQYIGAASLSGTGGMAAKFDTAQYAVQYEISCHVGHWQASIDALLAGEVGTTFVGSVEAAR